MEPTYGEAGDVGDGDFPQPTRALPIQSSSNPAPYSLASYYERGMVLNRLKGALAEGRLDDDAFDYRMRAALTAQTHGELEPLIADLPGPARPSFTAVRPVGWFTTTAFAKDATKRRCRCRAPESGPRRQNQWSWGSRPVLAQESTLVLVQELTPTCGRSAEWNGWPGRR